MTQEIAQILLTSTTNELLGAILMVLLEKKVITIEEVVEQIRVYRFTSAELNKEHPNGPKH